MNLGFGKRRQVDWCYVDCVGMQRFDISDFPCVVGAAGSCHLNRAKNGSVSIHKTNPDAEILLNGVPMNAPQLLETGSDYSVKVGTQFLLLRGDADLDAWIRSMNFQRWIVQDLAAGQVIGSVSFAELPHFVAQRGLKGADVITTIEGARQAFYLKDVVPATAFADAAPARNAEQPNLNHVPVPPERGPEPGPSPSIPEEPRGDVHHDEPMPQQAFPSEPEYPEEDANPINTVSGEFTCPHCWQHFDRGDVMWIAKHPSLRDPDLGEDFPLRFFPTSFDELGRAVDGMGVRCSDMACPNCKSRLPPQFLDLDTHIISIVGAPSAGKSYFLTSMINELEESLPRHFGLAFKDSDASGNAIVSDMRAKLFSDSSNPAEIALDKTVPGGEMFKSWERDGRQMKLPKPFTYLVSPFAADAGINQTLHLVFYDNAGEQFEPAERSESGESSDLDSTQHLASSKAILFLYDPASNVRFRRMLSEKMDPQLRDEKFLKLNRQDNIIAEMRNRIMTELNVDANDRIETPLLMLIGKCDLWAELIEAPFENPISEKGIDFAIVDRNSAKVREFLLQTSPGVVANAESISQTVVYFPVSPIGHSPQKFVPPGESDERIGPVPGMVNPLFPEVPVIWTLAKMHPEMFRSVEREEVPG
jgi:hypothetical protein